MRHYSKADIDTHSERFNGLKPAVNVKVYSGPRTSQVEDYFKCSEEVASQALQYAFESAQGRFWEDVQDVARDIFGKHVKVYSEGRSGGWLIVQGINTDVESWDAIAVSEWGKLAHWCAREIAYLTSWDYVREDIEANEWAKDGAELYNFRETKDGRTHCIADLKTAHMPK
jgi:hypothetical protein